MKISVRSIFHAHWVTLRNVGDTKASRCDIAVFYGVPTVGATVSYYFGVVLSPEVYSASISVFAIFSALLFSVQVAMYGVFRADRKTTNDAILNDDEQRTAEETRRLLREVNANVSYLILLSCLAVTVIVVFVAAPIPSRFEAATLMFLYLHFLLTVAMVLKRAHEVFDAEYATPLRFPNKSSSADKKAMPKDTAS
ncbi:MAG: hypothetical protein ACU0B7_07335 [Paracoccaceae bacterium]